MYFKPRLKISQSEEFTPFYVATASAAKTVKVSETNGEWYRVTIPYSQKQWIQKIKTIPGRQWQHTEKYWLVPKVKDSMKRLKALFKDDLELTIRHHSKLPEYWKSPIIQKPHQSSVRLGLNPMQIRAIDALEELLLVERKSWNTRRVYLSLLRDVLAYYRDTRPSRISVAQLNRFLLYKIKNQGIARSTQNQYISAFNAFFGKVCKQEDKIQKLRRPKKEKKLPNVLSQEEVKALLDAVDNEKHRCMLLLLYSAGLRKSELLRLRVDDLKFSRSQVFIKDSKGHKDRFSLFSHTAQKHLRRYLDHYQPRYWLFEGYAGGPYSASSLQSIFSAARKKSRINPFITLHGLRHSFATHLVDGGVGLHAVRQLLGHYSLKTTEIYLHTSKGQLAQIKSPLENLNM